MNFSGLKRLIESADEHAFYDVALLLLTQLGYRDLHIVDGPNDGGKDVNSDRENVQMQLSVRKDWDRKIREEAANAIGSAKSHLIYVTNRRISPREEASFRNSFSKRYKLELTIYDSQRIATILSFPGRIARSYKILGVDVKASKRFTVSDIAASVQLLFGSDAIALREAAVDSVVLAWLRFNAKVPEEAAIQSVAKLIPGASPKRLVSSSISRLRAGGSIIGSKSAIEITQDAIAKVDCAEAELLASRAADITFLSDKFEIAEKYASQLLEIGIELNLRAKKGNYVFKLARTRRLCYPTLDRPAIWTRQFV